MGLFYVSSLRSKNENPVRMRLVFKSESIAKESQCEIDYL